MTLRNQSSSHWTDFPAARRGHWHRLLRSHRHWPQYTFPNMLCTAQPAARGGHQHWPPRKSPKQVLGCPACCKRRASALTPMQISKAKFMLPCRLQGQGTSRCPTWKGSSVAGERALPGSDPRPKRSLTCMPLIWRPSADASDPRGSRRDSYKGRHHTSRHMCRPPGAGRCGCQSCCAAAKWRCSISAAG